MESKRNLGDEGITILSKQRKIGQDGKSGVETIECRQKRRPWRNKVRRKAAKEAKKNEKGKEVIRFQIDEDIEATRKKKRKKRKKMSDFGDVSNDIHTVVQATDGLRKLNTSLFRYINEQLYTMTSSEASELFRKDPQAFEIYHQGYQEQSKQWPYKPVYDIVRWIRTIARDGLIVADMGCGDAKIAKALENIATVHSYDLVASNDRVTACDMSKVPLGNESVDIVVFCLSLMGTNLSDYFREANRLLKKGGSLKIAEIASRFISVKQFTHALSKMGFELLEKKLKGDGYFIIFEFIKRGKVGQKRPLGLKLKPCLYKKR